MKKGQAAMEFLMTYGWAIVVVLTALVALSYFGVLDVGKYAPTMCTLPTGLSCLDHSVSYVPPPPIPGMLGKNDLVINFKNNLGVTIDLQSIEFTQYSRTEPLNLFPNIPNGRKTGTPGPPSIDNIEVDDFTDSATTGTVFESGEKYEIEFTMTYKNIESDLSHTVTGTVTGKVD